MPLLISVLETLLNSKFVTFEDQDSGLFVKLKDNNTDTHHLCEVDIFTGNGVQLPKHFELVEGVDLKGTQLRPLDNETWLSTNWVGRMDSYLENSERGVVVLPEFSDGGNYAINVGPEPKLADKYYLPCYDTLGFGIYAVQYDIFTTPLSYFNEARLKYPEKFLTIHLASARQAVDFEPSLWDATLFGSHCKEARKLEKDRIYGEQVAEKLGFAVPKSLTITNVEGVDTADWDSIPTHKLAVKYLNDQFIGIMTKDNLDVIRGLLQANGEPLFIQEYLGDQIGEYNFMFLINDDHVVPVGTSIEHNRLFESGLGGKAGNTLSAHHIGMSPALQSVYEKIKDLHKHTKGLNGWVDITFIKSGDTFYFTEWMVRTACSNFAVILEQFETSYVDILIKLNDKTLTFEDLGVRKQYSMGLDLFQVEFAISISTNPIFIEAPESFIPIDSALGIHEYGDKKLVPVNLERKNPRIGIIRGCGNEPESIALEINRIANGITNIQDLAYRTDLSDWSSRLLDLSDLKFG